MSMATDAPTFSTAPANGVLVLNKKQGFVESKGLGPDVPRRADHTGLRRFRRRTKRPTFSCRRRAASKLFRNDGKGHFTDVTARSGALAAPVGAATCAAWADFNNRGKLDLIVGCLRGPNRYFRNNGDGTFADASEEIGFLQRIFNTRGLCTIDLNKDGVLDVVFNNEGQESSVLIGDPQRVATPPVAKQ